MGDIKYPSKVKLVIPTLYSDEKKIIKTYEKLITIYGDVDYLSPLINFTFTDFYNTEMGTPIWRIIYSFKRLIKPDELADIKLKTNELELMEAQEGKRKVNLDPGYIELSKFVLATTKDYSHRIYIGKGIFAECTLLFKKKSFKSCEWTYRDYRTAEYIKILNLIRDIYKKQIENEDFSKT